jgi:DNA-binding beta-propeller fold protein YncE
MMKLSPRLSVLIFLLSVFPVLFAQDNANLGTDIAALNAREALRVGLDAYNRFAFNEAILALEQALSYRPGEGLILDWLGKAYYRSGLEGIALQQWQSALETYPPAAPEAVLIRSRIEFVNSHRSFYPSLREASRYVGIGFFPGSYEGTTFYRQPTAVLANGDGSVWTVCYGSNEIIRLDVNGVIRDRRRGPLTGFDRPYDIVRGLDGRLYVSEFRGGRISVLSDNGNWLAAIGEKGLNAGQLAGPAALAVDDQGYIYTAEFGNRRISKFDPDGVFITSFGRRDELFPGFLAPTGIAFKDGVLYAADSVARAIYMFDSNGAYLGILTAEGMNAPESLRVFPDGSLLVADTRRLLLIDTDSTIVKEITATGNSRIRYVGAGLDGNGSLLAANFDESEVSVLASLNDVASGLFVQIERIISDDFPKVSLELSVQGAGRRPVIGLNESNFMLSERGYPVANQALLGVGNANTGAGLSVLIERSEKTARMTGDIAAAVSDINAAMRESGGGIASIVSAGERPVLERFDASNPATLAQAAAGTGSGIINTAHWRFDMGLRLAATDLLPRSKKRAVVFISSGELGELAFEQYALVELAAYLANNNIKFYCILSADGKASGELKYLCDETDGTVLHLYRPEGIGPVLKSLAGTPAGTYSFSWDSSLSTDFGRAFLPVSVEVRLLERSGRDESGYFPPLE